MPIDFRGYGKADLVGGKVPLTQLFPMVKSGGGDTLTLDFQVDGTPPGGTKGLTLNRAAIGNPIGLTFKTGGVADWDLAEDAISHDLVLAASYNTDGASLYGDQFRLDQAGHGGYSKGLGLQSHLRRWNFSSNTEDDPAMQTLVQFENPLGSPVVYAIDIIHDGQSQARITRFGNFILGPGDKTSSAGVSVFGGAAADLKGAIEQTNSAVGGRKWQWVPGDPGVSEGGLLLRDVTSGTVKRILLTPGGDTRFWFGTNLAANATEGFIFAPLIANNPTALPVGYGGNVNGAICINATTGNVNYTVGSQWWHIAGIVGAG